MKKRKESIDGSPLSSNQLIGSSRKNAILKKATLKIHAVKNLGTSKRSLFNDDKQSKGSKTRLMSTSPSRVRSPSSNLSNSKHSLEADKLPTVHEKIETKTFRVPKPKKRNQTIDQLLELSKSKP